MLIASGRRSPITIEIGSARTEGTFMTSQNLLFPNPDSWKQNPTVRRYNHVFIGKQSVVEDFCVLGVPSRGSKTEDNKTTRIGQKAHIRSHTVIYGGNVIGDDFQTGSGVFIREANRIGGRVSIGTHSVVEHHVIIEDDVRIHSNAFIPEFSILRRGAWIGPNAVLTNARYPLCRFSKQCIEGPTIEVGAKVGANVTILPGVSIGKDSLIGAGSVVTKNVPARAVMVGNPASQIGAIDDLNCRRELCEHPYG